VKLTATEDISAPIGHVFTQLCQADRLEQMVRKRGGKVARTPQGPIAAGTCWDAAIMFRGNPRNLAFTLAELDTPERMVFAGKSDGMDLGVVIELVALSPHTTRLSVETEARPRTLAARLLMQSAKLARGMMLTRYRKRIADFAAQIEKAHRTA
jgi:hypothetical protein